MRPLSASIVRFVAPHFASLRLVFVLAALVSVASVVAAPPAAIAASLSEKQAQAEQLDKEVGKLENTYGDLQERWRGAIVELREIQADAEDAQAKLRVARRDLSGAKVRLEDRALAIYRDGGGGSNQLVQVAEAGSVSEFFDRIETIRRVGDQDADILGRVRSAEERVAQQEARLRAARDRQAKVVRRAATAKRRMGKVLGQRREKLGSVTAEVRTIMEQQRAAAAAADAAAAREQVARIVVNGKVVSVPAAQGGGASAGAAESSSTGGGEGGGSTDAAADGGTSGAATTDDGGSTQSSDGGSDSGGSSTSGGSSPASVPLPPASGGAASAASIAMGKVGTPYVFGAAGPNSFDCSGLVVWAFAQAGRSGLPHSTYSLIGMGVEVPMSQAQVGDLVFTNNSGHMGIYVGGGSFVHAPRTGRTVSVESLSYYSIVSIRRI